MSAEDTGVLCGPAWGITDRPWPWAEAGGSLSVAARVHWDALSVFVEVVIRNQVLFGGPRGCKWFLRVIGREVNHFSG